MDLHCVLICGRIITRNMIKRSGSVRLHFQPITDANRREAQELRVAHGQESFIETVEECLEEAERIKNWRPVGIYDGKKLVGFAMYGYFFWEYFPIERLWLDRFLIDKSFQGMGYGREALSALLSRLSEKYPRSGKIFLSIVQGNQTASSLYEKFGFHFTGEKDINGEDVMVKERRRRGGF